MANINVQHALGGTITLPSCRWRWQMPAETFNLRSPMALRLLFRRAKSPQRVYSWGKKNAGKTEAKAKPKHKEIMRKC